MIFAMQFLRRNALLLMLALSTIAFSGCEDEVSLEELNARKMVGNWQIGQTGSVRFDLNNVTSEFTSFQITFTGDKNGGTYSTIGGQDVFDSSGTWGFMPGNANGIRLSGVNAASGRTIVLIFSGANLILDFTVGSGSTTGDGVTIPMNISGRFRFELEPRR